MAKNSNSLSDEKVKGAAGGSSVKQCDDGGWYVFDEELDDQVSHTFDGKDKGYWKGKEEAKKNY